MLNFWVLPVILLSSHMYLASAAIEDCKCWISIVKRTPCKNADRLSTRQECEAAGCCHDDVTSLFVLGWKGTCYERDGKCPIKACQVPPAEREKVGFYAINKRRCKRLGGCFDESRQDPTCFKKRKNSELKFRTTTEAMTTGTTQPGPGFRITESVGLALVEPAVKSGEVIKAQMSVLEDSTSQMTKKKSDTVFKKSAHSTTMATTTTKPKTYATETTIPVATNSYTTSISTDTNTTLTTTLSETSLPTQSRNISASTISVVSTSAMASSTTSSNSTAIIPTVTSPIATTIFSTFTTNLTTPQVTSSTTSPMTSSFISTSNPMSVKPTRSPGYYGPNGIYVLGGFTMFAQCPTEKQQKKSCMRKSMTKDACYKHFCCWKEPDICHLPIVKTVKWPQAVALKKPIWSTWSTWSKCTSIAPACTTTTQTRTRRCKTKINNKPNCKGKNEESRSCAGFCKASWSDWGTWMSCSESCGPGVIRRARLCRKGGNLAAPSNCQGGFRSAGEDKPCNIDLCSQWSAWSSGPCPAKCGSSGIGVQERTCKQTDKKLGETQCSLKVKVCWGTPCPTIEQLRKLPEWSPWSKWSACSNSCGIGTRKRKRACSAMDGLIATQNVRVIPGHTTSCLGGNEATMQEQTCNEELCISWSRWVAPRTCSVLCGGGIKEIKRTCLAPGQNIIPTSCSRTRVRCNGNQCPK